MNHQILSQYYWHRGKAGFRLKATGVDDSDTVAILMVERYYYSGPIYDTVAIDTFYGSDFTGAYDSLSVFWNHDNPPAKWKDIWARYYIYWCGNGVLYFDEVLSTDEVGIDLIVNENLDQEVLDYTDDYTYGTNGEYLLAWHLLDERTAPENATCYRRVDSLLREGTGGKGGFQQFSFATDAWSATKLLKFDYFMRISYPGAGSKCEDDVISDEGALSFSTDNPGGDSVSLQTAWNGCVPMFKKYKHWADSIDATFWAKVGAYRTRDTCDGVYYEDKRYLTGFELLCHCNLALAYGADALTFWVWGYDSGWRYGIFPHNQAYLQVRDTVSPFICALGDVFYDLDWGDAGPSEDVASLDGSFISLISSDDFPSSPYIEVAYFQDTTVVYPEHGRYFFLVNRRCLAEEAQTVVISFPDFVYGNYLVDQYTYDSIVFNYPVHCSGPTTAIINLEPGQGKLFHFPAAGVMALPIVDSLQCIDGTELTVAGNGFEPPQGGRYFCLDNTGDSTQSVRVWLNKSEMAFSSAEMYYIVDDLTGDTIAITGPMPDSEGNNVPFTMNVPPGGCSIFRVLPINTSGSGLDDSYALPAQWEGGILLAEKTINVGDTIQILGPATLRMLGSCRFEISGTLAADGTSSDSVKFISAAASPAPNDWDWIKVNAGGTLDLDYCEIKHAYKGVWAYSETVPLTILVNHCLIDSMQSAGVEISTVPESNDGVFNSTIGKCGNYGVNMKSGYAAIIGNTFTDESGYTDYWCHVGDIMWPKSSALVESNVFDVSIGWGVMAQYLDLPELQEDLTVQYNTFYGGYGAIVALYCSTSVAGYNVKLHRNVITNESANGEYGILNYNTASQISGDNSLPRDSSRISGWQYGIMYWTYCVYPEWRESTVRQLYFTDNDYHIYNHDSAMVDIGKDYQLLYGNNHFGAQSAGEYTVYSLSPNTVHAESNYWDDTTNIRTYGDVDYDPWLTSPPFLFGYPLPLPKSADVDDLPESPSLAQNYPNPFNLGTQIQFSLATGGHVSIKIYNILGQRICQLLDDEYRPGNHQVFWDGRDEQGQEVAGGVYFYKIESAEHVETKKMVVIK